MNNNFDTLCRHFEAEGIDCTSHPEAHLVKAALGLQHTTAFLTAHAPPNEPILTLALRLPVTIPPGKRPAVGEFLHRLNQAVRAGAFELDYDDGEVRLTMATLPDPDQVIDVAALERWLLLACVTVDGYWPALMKVIFAEATPAHAVEQAEAHLRDYLSRFGTRQK